jgi:hypothetical protein
LVVVSPATYLAPVEISPADLLAQSLVLALLTDLQTQAVYRYDVEPYRLRFSGGLPSSSWLDGVRLWQLWANDLPLAAWREPVVRWVFARPAGDIPAFAPALCAMHRLWLGWPYQIRVPMICDIEGQAVPSDFWCQPRMAALRLADLVAAANDSMMRPMRESRLGKEVALATVVAYAATAYGPERIPLLIARIDKHGSWETLIPAVFGVSMAEFEAGWQDYLAERYGVPAEQD